MKTVADFLVAVQFRLGWTMRRLAKELEVNQASPHYWRRNNFIPINKMKKCGELLPEEYPTQFFIDLYKEHAPASERNSENLKNLH